MIVQPAAGLAATGATISTLVPHLAPVSRHGHAVEPATPSGTSPYRGRQATLLLHSWTPGGVVDTDQATAEYLDVFADPENEALRAARALSEEENVPLVSHLTGSWLRWLAALRPAHDVVEVGGGVGYSALWLLSGMHPRGMLTTIEIDPDRRSRAQRLLTHAGHGQRVRSILGAALTVLPKLADRSYDLVFIDAAKSEYPAYLAHAKRLLRPGGLLIADNVLWHGRVADASVRDEDTVAIRAFTTTVHDDPAFHAQILPIGDGVLIARLTEPGT
jgi:predicted O-methyltransferase YrrM